MIFFLNKASNSASSFMPKGSNKIIHKSLVELVLKVCCFSLAKVNTNNINKNSEVIFKECRSANIPF